MLWVAKRFFKLFPLRNVRPPSCAFAGSGATTTFSVVNCSVCFRAEAKFASMADMRRRAVLRVVEAHVGFVFAAPSQMGGLRSPRHHRADFNDIFPQGGLRRPVLRRYSAFQSMPGTGLSAGSVRANACGHDCRRRVASACRIGAVGAVLLGEFLVSHHQGR